MAKYYYNLLVNSHPSYHVDLEFAVATGDEAKKAAKWLRKFPDVVGVKVDLINSKQLDHGFFRTAGGVLRDWIHMGQSLVQERIDKTPNKTISKTNERYLAKLLEIYDEFCHHDKAHENLEFEVEIQSSNQSDAVFS